MKPNNLEVALVPAVLTAAVLTMASPAISAGLDVVVTSKPVHSLAAAVMEGIGTPKLIIEGAASPHTFSLKPSGAKAISRADVFIRVSETIEPFTRKLITTLPRSVEVVTLADTGGLELLPRRRGATFEAHAHGDSTAGHGAKGHGHKHHDHDDDDHDDDGASAGSATDGHVWLDPANARKMVSAIAAVLARRSPEHRERLDANAKALNQQIEAVEAQIAQTLRPFAGRPFVVFHDATQYFERRFGLTAAGSITVSPDVQPSAKRLSEVRAKIKKTAAACVFSEPNYKKQLMTAVTEGTSSRPGTIDPEALSFEPGPRLYVELLQSLASNFKACLSASS